MPFAAMAQDPLPSTVRRVKPAIVGVATYQLNRSPQAVLLGTGFAVGDGRHVLTNHHVATAREVTAEQGESLVVLVGTGSRVQVRKATIAGSDDLHDLSLLRIAGEALPKLDLGNSDNVEEGERFAFTGYPIGAALGLYPATHLAMIAAITPVATPADRSERLDARTIRRMRDGYSVFQLDATAYPGNSGSPLYRVDSGAVVGIINQVFVKESRESALTSPSGISYAVPIKHALPLLRKAGQ